MNDDLFAPPTKEEIAQAKTAAPAPPHDDLFDPPTKEEMAAAAPALPTKAEPSLMSKVGSGIGKWASDSAGRFKDEYVKPVTDAFSPDKALPIAKGIPFLGEAAERGGAALGAGIATNVYPGTGTYDENFNRLLGDQHKREGAYEAANPKASTALEMASGGTMPVAPAMKSATDAGRLARAGVGAANAASRIGTNAALSAGDAYEKGQDPGKAAIEGAIMAGGLEGAGGLAGAAKGQLTRGQADVDRLSAYLKDLAEKKAFKAAVGNQAKPYAEAAAKGQINDRGRELLDSGVVGFGTSAQGIADRAKPEVARAGEDIANVAARADEGAANRYLEAPGVEPAGNVSGKQIADVIRAKAKQIGGKGNQSTVAALEDAAQHYEAMGDHGMTQAQVEKNSWKYKFGADRDVNNIVKGAVGDAMDAGAVKAGMGPEYEDAKSRYGTMAAAVKDATVNANRYAKNNSASLGDKAAAGAAAYLVPGSGLVKGAAALASGAANKLVRKRGTSALAVGADKAADLLKNAPETLGNFAGLLRDAQQRGSLPLVHQLLMQKPEYRQIMEGSQQ